MIAKAFASYKDRSEIVIFASGVSNSLNLSDAAFNREINLIQDSLTNNPECLFIYFSTCSINDASLQHSAYVKHKKKIEEYIVANHAPYIIFRLTNPVGNTNNTNTVINYFINNVTKQHHFEVWENASRNLIDIDDMYIICNEIIEQHLFLNSIVNIANPQSYPVPFIVELIEKYFNKKGMYSSLKKGSGPVIDVSAIEPLFRKFNINFEADYLTKLLQKYFPTE